MDITNQLGSESSSVRPLHLLTIDALLADLISGREIATEQQQFKLLTNESRSVLNWYRKNRLKWSKNLQAQDCEAIVDCIELDPPILPEEKSASQRERNVRKLKKLVAHRFAGLHAYGDKNEPPKVFEFEPEKSITLFEGWNGSGKTSLLNAIIWCLTGHLLRAQRLPESGEQEFGCFIDQEEESNEHQITPVTPLPSSGTWTPEASAKVIPADTWVELTFVDENNNELPPIRRTQSRTSRGKLEETYPSSSSIGVDPIAFQLGTSMPGMLPFLQVGSTSDLGVAVARLTGLAELVFLATHATKAKNRIATQIKNQRQEELAKIEEKYFESFDDLEERINEFPSMRPKLAVPAVNDESVGKNLEELKAHFETLKANGLRGAKEVLGENFDAEKVEDRENLEKCIQPAVQQISNLSSLPSIQRLGAMKLSANQEKSVRQTLETIYQELTILAELASNPVLARRTQLYARVSAWMEEHKYSSIESCAVCRAPIKNVVDPETELQVVNHLQQVKDNSDFVSKTIDQWATSWTGSLSRDFPDGLREELSKDLPLNPAALVKTALLDELFNTVNRPGFVGG